MNKTDASTWVIVVRNSALCTYQVVDPLPRQHKKKKNTKWYRLVKGALRASCRIYGIPPSALGLS